MATLKYNIGDKKFKTKKECETFTRNIINNLGCCEIKRGHTYFTFFEDLLMNHQDYDEKKGTGIDYFYIQYNQVCGKYYQTLIKRVDKSDEVFSWVHCCQFRDRTPLHNLINAMRESINEQTIKYRQDQEQLICVYCKTDNQDVEYHVDHDKPSFKVLKDDFLSLTRKEKPNTFGHCSLSRQTIFNKEDKDFKLEWVYYHKKNCNLQILCKDCNLRKQK